MKTLPLFPKQKFRFLIVPLFLLFLFTTCEKENIDNNPLQENQTNYQLGFIPTPNSVYSNVPNAPTPSPSGTLPSSFFLEIPNTPFNQGQQGSCVSCASSMTKSILDHFKLNTPYTNGEIIYSPSFLFNQCHADPNNCLVGSYVTSNLEILKNQGICKLSEMPYDQSNCTTQPNNSQRNKAALHKIDHYFKIDPISISWIKEFIYVGHPVIIAFQVDDFFMNAKTNSLWKQFGLVSRGNHCTLLYGWDDNKNAFKMLNSWGSQWGNNGIVWVDYNFIQNGHSLLYGKIFYEAYILQNPAVDENIPTADFDVDGKNTIITVGQQITFVDKSLNKPTSWSWSFPGGTPNKSSSQNPKITYSNAGDFDVSLTVSNNSGNDTRFLNNYIHVTQAIQNPIAQFSTKGGTNVTAGSSVSFIDQSSNDPTSWSWSFPGGTPASSTSKNPTIAYSIPGNYDVSLTVYNQAGNGTKTLSNYIHVDQSTQNPVARFFANGSTNITAGSSITFVDQSSNNPTSWSWSFPGGTPGLSSLQNPTVTYSTPGNYNVSLTVSNQAGSDSQIQYDYITVISNQTEVCGQPFTDPRDGNTYATINVGGQCWMAEDFRYISKNSVVSNGQRYYEYSDAINIAPSGWHLPSDEEWQSLEIFLGMSRSDANSFGWRGTDQGTKVLVGGSSGLNLNMYGLAVRDFDNGIKFYDYLNWGNYWTSTKYYNSNPAVNSYITIGRAVSKLVPSQIYRFNSDVSDNFYSVRFVRD